MGVSYPVSLMIISLIINRTAGLSYSSMAAWHRKAVYAAFLLVLSLFPPCYNGGNVFDTEKTGS